jgi:hypothetical protein
MQKLISFLIFYVLIISAICAQSGYLPHKRDNVSSETYKNNIDVLQRDQRNLSIGEIKTKRDTCVMYYQIGISYADLYEPNDSVFAYIDKAMSMDSYRICKLLLFRDSLVNVNKKARPIFSVDSIKFGDYKNKCQLCIDKEMNNRLAKINLALKEKDVNVELVNLLKSMAYEDQLYRIEISKHTEQQKIDSLWQLQRAIDKRNQFLLDSIFQKYGYPTKKLVTEFYQSNAIIILLHTPSYFQKKHLNMLILSYKSGNAGAIDIMMLLDKICIEDNSKQLFGTQSYTDGRKTKFFSIEDGNSILNQLGLNELVPKLRKE